MIRNVLLKLLKIEVQIEFGLCKINFSLNQTVKKHSLSKTSNKRCKNNARW